MVPQTALERTHPAAEWTQGIWVGLQLWNCCRTSGTDFTVTWSPFIEKTKTRMDRMYQSGIFFIFILKVCSLQQLTRCPDTGFAQGYMQEVTAVTFATSRQAHFRHRSQQNCPADYKLPDKLLTSIPQAHHLFYCPTAYSLGSRHLPEV